MRVVCIWKKKYLTNTKLLYEHGFNFMATKRKEPELRCHIGVTSIGRIHLD